MWNRDCPRGQLSRPSSSPRRIAALAVVAAALTTGCVSMSSDPPPSSVAVPAAWRQADDVATVAPPEDLSRWWELLGDETLTQLIALSLDANHDLRTACSRLREARARRSLAQVDLLPSVNAAVTSTTQSTSGDHLESDTRTLYSAGFDAAWEPDIFGAARSALRAEEADLAASEADLNSTRVSLVAEVARNYVELRSSQARLIIASENLARQAETLELTAWRKLAGLTSELDVAQARAGVEQTRAQLPSFETAIAEAQHRLAILAGRAPTALAEVLSAPGPMPTVDAVVVPGIPADTLRQRPDVAASERRLVAATARVDEARAARYPSFKLAGTLVLEGASTSALGGAETVLGSLLGSLTAPLFNRARIERTVDLRSEAEEQALISYEQVILSALEEVENALVRLASAARSTAALTTAVASAREAATLARDSYAAGLESYQSVLDTERSLLAVEDGLASSQADAATALIRLYKALGGGWTASPTGDTAEPGRVES